MDILDKKIEEMRLLKDANLDCLVSRFCIETGLEAKNVEIVHQSTPNGYKTYVRKYQYADT